VYPYGQDPKLGAIICWNGGFGHVAVVEKIEGDTVTFSESNYPGYGAPDFAVRTYSKDRVKTYTTGFQGYIYIGDYSKNEDVQKYAYVVNGATNKGSELKKGQALEREQYLSSPNKKFVAKLQQDGNFVVFSTARVLWATATENKSANHLILQDDGNLVIYKGDNKALWDTGTWKSGKKADRLVMQDDGNLVAYASSGAAVWATNTDRVGGASEFNIGGTAPTPVPSAPGVPEGNYVIRSVADSNKVLNVLTYGTPAHLNKVSVWGHSKGDVAQIWNAKKSDDAYILYSGNPNVVLNVYTDNQAAHNNKVNVYNMLSDITQMWVFEDVGNGQYVIHSASNRNVVLTADGTGDGSLIYVRDYSGAATQKWTLENA
jgi:hypothetical protein